MDLNRPDEAIQTLQESLEINPISGTALSLARTCMILGRNEEMDQALATASRLEPDNGFIHVLRGDRYSLQQRIPEALAEYEKALRIDEHRVGMVVRPVMAKLKSQSRGTQTPGQPSG
jgi:tetratricopeptide (TPR) repeat protein